MISPKTIRSKTRIPKFGSVANSTPAPVNTVAPTVQLDDPPGRVGTTASVADNGTWTNSPTSFSYQWLFAGSPIEGATSDTFTLTIAQTVGGEAVTCVVTAMNAGGSASLGSNAVAPAPLSIPVEDTPAVITEGSPGSFSIATAATWTANPPTISATAYQWQESADNSTWSDLSGETGATLTGGSTDIYYRVAVTATNTQGDSPPSYSNSLQAT